MAESLDEWIERQHALSVQGLLRSISPTLTKTRPGFGQIIVAKPGSVIASPVLAAYDPEPDYFFHWFRDAALVMEALRVTQADGVEGSNIAELFGDFVRFNLGLHSLDGAAIAASHWRDAVSEPFQQFLRSNDDLQSVRAYRVLAETRVNPDASLDISQWARPQYDGAALTALTLLRWLRRSDLSPDIRAGAESLLQADLEFALRYGGQVCFDIWEEEQGHHYYTMRVSAAALQEGALWLEQRGATGMADDCRRTAAVLLRTLDGYWLQAQEHYRSRILKDGAASTKELDIAVILAVIHCEDGPGAHSVSDPKILATLDRLEQLFESEYPLNRTRPAQVGTAMGRYAGDHYYSGGPYFFSTLGAAELCYRAAAQAAHPKALKLRGDEFMRMVRAYAPPDGRLAEQFDRHSGAPSSARDLAWSHAAFITARSARCAIPRSGWIPAR
jgi:glucoamylase